MRITFFNSAFAETFLLNLQVQTLSHARKCVWDRQVCGRSGQKQVWPVLCRHGQAGVLLSLPHRPPPSSAALHHRSLNTDNQLQIQTGCLCSYVITKCIYYNSALICHILRLKSQTFSGHFAVITLINSEFTKLENSPFVTYE